MRSLVVACILLVGLWAIAPDTPDIHPRDAPDHEGRTVRMHGVVTQVQAWEGGGTFRLAHHGFAIDARVEGPLPSPGLWLEATGDLRRSAGELRLYAEGWIAGHHEAPAMPLAAIAQEPDSWRDHDLLVHGDIRGTRIHDHGVSMAYHGPGDGMARVQGVMQYEAECACFALHARSHTPWTP